MNFLFIFLNPYNQEILGIIPPISKCLQKGFMLVMIACVRSTYSFIVDHQAFLLTGKNWNVLNAEVKFGDFYYRAQEMYTAKRGKVVFK